MRMRMILRFVSLLIVISLSPTPTTAAAAAEDSPVSLPFPPIVSISNVSYTFDCIQWLFNDHQIAPSASQSSQQLCPQLSFNFSRHSALPLEIDQYFFIGDSQMRHQYVALLHMLNISSEPFDNFKGHHDFDFPLPLSVDSRIKFFWRPFLNETIELLHSIHKHETKSSIFLSINVGSWDLLHHKNNAEKFTVDVESLRKSLEWLLSSRNIEIRGVVIQSLGLLEDEKFTNENKQIFLKDEFGMMFSKILYDNLFVPLSLTFPNKMFWINQRMVMKALVGQTKDKESTTDGIHPVRPIVDFMTDVITNLVWLQYEPKSSLSDTQNQIPFSFGPSLTKSRTRSLLEGGEKTADSNNTHPKNATVSLSNNQSSFIGRDPVLGALVGLYILLSLFLKDPFLISNPLLKLLGSN